MTSDDISRVFVPGAYLGPQRFGGSEENDYFFREPGSPGKYFRNLGSTLIVLGLREPCKKVFKNLTLKEKPSFCLIFLKKNLGLLGGSYPDD